MFRSLGTLELKTGKTIARSTLTCLLVLMALLFAASGEASVVRALTLAQLVGTSDMVAVVVATDSTVIGSKPSELSRRVSAHVEQCLVGDCPQNVSILLRGGSRDGIAKVVPGEASVSPGERVLVFLNRGSSSRWATVVGLSQGLFLVSEREGMAFVQRSTLGLSLVGERCDQGGAADLACAAQSFEAPLSAFIERIRALAR